MEPRNLTLSVSRKDVAQREPINNFNVNVNVLRYTIPEALNKSEETLFCPLLLLKSFFHPLLPSISLGLYHLLPLFIISLKITMWNPHLVPFDFSPGSKHILQATGYRGHNGLQQQGW